MEKKEGQLIFDGKIEIYLYEWLLDITRYFDSKIYHQFILHFNINDFYIENENSFVKTLNDYISSFFQISHKPIAVFQFYPSIGILWNEKDDAAASVAKKAGIKQGRRSQASIHNTLNDLDLLYHADPDILKIILIQYFEKIVPERRTGTDATVDLAVEKFQRWALDESIMRDNNLIICFTDNLQMVSGVLHGQGRRCKAIRIPLPTENERLMFFNILQKESALQPLEVFGSLESLAGMIRGFTLYDCHALNSIAMIKRNPISPALVNELKKDIIKEHSRDLLEEVELTEGDSFDAIGGMESIKEYLKQIQKRLNERDEVKKFTIPKGLLLVGPPGTGKTILAKALARESGIPMVRMANIRSMWVGESERNLDLVLKLIEDMAPVLVFVDEIDQAIGSRGSGSGDSGTSQRIFGRLLEFMGREDIHGEILWVAASNRPDMLDDAMIRRFDKVFPILLPGASDRVEIFKRLKYSIPYLKYNDDVDFTLLGSSTDGLTGSDISVIVRTALEDAEIDGQYRVLNLTQNLLMETVNNFKSNHNEDMYDLQTLYAIRYCNFIKMLPDAGSLPHSIREAVVTAKEKKTNESVDNKIYELSRRLRTGV